MSCEQVCRVCKGLLLLSLGGVLVFILPNVFVSFFPLLEYLRILTIESACEQRRLL